VATKKDNRAHHRVMGPFDGCRVGVLDTPLLIYNLSEGGCFVNSLYDTPVGQRLVLKISLPNEGIVTIDAETVYVQPGFGFAVRFVAVSDETRAILGLSLDKLRQNVA
jgi:PilZ domain-containing protein